MAQVFKDCQNKVIKVGQKVAVYLKSYSEMHVGIVIKINPKKVKVQGKGIEGNWYPQEICIIEQPKTTKE